MSDFNSTYLCSYRSDGLTHTARIRAASAADAARRMQALNWAPGSGPIGWPRKMPAPQPEERSALADLQQAFLRWAAQ